MLELRKAYTMRVAEMLVETQKRTEANFKAEPNVANKPLIK